MVRESGNLKLIRDVVRLTEEGKIDKALVQFRKLLLFTGKFSKKERKEIYDMGELFKSEKIRSYSGKFLGEIDKKIKKKEHENLYFIKSEIIINLGDDKVSLEFLGKAIKKYPEYAEFLNSRASILQDKGRLDDALKDINEAIEIEKNAICLNTRALILKYKDKLDDALKDINEAIEIEKNATRLNNRAFILKDKGKLDKALEDINEAIEIEDRNPVFWANKIYILKDKNPIDAKNTLRLAQTRFPGNKHILAAEAALEFSEKTKQQKKLSEEIDKKYAILEKELTQTKKQLEDSKKEDATYRKQMMSLIEENKIKIVEFLGIFAGIIAFIVSGITIMKDHSLFESLILMFGLALSLISFVLAIDVIVLSRFYDGERKTETNAIKKKYLFLRVIIATFLTLIIIAGLIEHPDIASGFCNILRVVLSLFISKIA